MASVTVCGTARAAVRPDRATLDLGISHVAPTSAAAMDQVAERSAQLAGHLAALGFDERDWSTQGITLAEEWEWKQDANTRVGFRATSGITVGITRLDGISALLKVAVDTAGAQVRNLQWLVAPDNPARDSLLFNAVIDAKRRAEAYVAALGLGLGQVEQISDLPITGSDQQPNAQIGMLRSAKSADAGSMMPVNPGEIELAASVYIRFGTVSHL